MIEVVDSLLTCVCEVVRLPLSTFVGTAVGVVSVTADDVSVQSVLAEDSRTEDSVVVLGVDFDPDPGLIDIGLVDVNELFDSFTDFTVLFVFDSLDVSIVVESECSEAVSVGRSVWLVFEVACSSFVLELFSTSPVGFVVVGTA